MKDLLRRSQMGRKQWSVSVIVFKSSMASNFILRRKAEEYLTAIIDYVAQDNPTAAIKIYETFFT